MPTSVGTVRTGGESMGVMRYAAALAAGYLLGSVPTGLIVGKLTKGIDLRDFGSGKLGATNALRTLGKGPAVMVVSGDCLKGVLAVGTAKLVAGDVKGEVLAGFAAVLGHNWPIFAEFRGGRGVLVSISVLTTLCWPASLITIGCGLPVIAVWRMVSLGVLCASVTAPVATIPFVVRGHTSPWVLAYVLTGSTLVIVQHRDNIERLLAGTERKIGQDVQPVA